jgi:hypothetical protein
MAGWFEDVMSGLFGGGQGINDTSDIQAGAPGMSPEANNVADQFGVASFSPITPELDFFNQANAAPQNFDAGSNFSGGMNVGGGGNALQGFNLNMPGGSPAAGGPRPDPNDINWKKMMLAAGIPLGTNLVSAGMQTLMRPSQPKMPNLPPPPAPASQSIAPFTDLPGTNASPLITQAPGQVVNTGGLQKKPSQYGGFSLY